MVRATEKLSAMSQATDFCLRVGHGLRFDPGEGTTKQFSLKLHRRCPRAATATKLDDLVHFCEAGCMFTTGTDTRCKNAKVEDLSFSHYK